MTTASWADLGYRNLGPASSDPEAFANKAVKAASTYGYESIVDSSGQWIRRQARKKGYAYKPPITLEGVLDAGNFLTASYRTIEQISHNSYFTTSKPHPIANLADLRETLTNAEHSTAARYYYRLAQAVWACDPDWLSTLLKEDILPRFFQGHPHGKVLVFQHDFNFLHSLGFLRALYTLKNYPIEFKSTQGFEALRDWQFVDPSSFFRTALFVANHLTYPYLLGFTAQSYGVTFEFIFSESEEQELPPFPADWNDWGRSESGFAQERLTLQEILSDPQSPSGQKAAHQRFLGKWRPTVDDTFNFTTWLSQATGRLLFELSDCCNFVESGIVDPVWAFENLLTVDRILHRALATFTVDEVGTRKNLAFEVADLLDALAQSTGHTATEADYFKALFRPSQALTDLAAYQASVPEPFRARLIEIQQQVYNDLGSSILSSVWLPGKSTSAGILVRSRDLATENLETPDDYVANTLRALRNAHHGYMTKQDPRGRRPSRYLALTRGNIPDSITILPILWWLAFVATTGGLIGWTPLEISNYD